MKNYIFLSVFIIFSTFQGISQTANPLSITVEDIDMTMLSKAEQAKWKTKIQKFSQPTFADDCTPEQQTFNRIAITYARTVVATKAFEDLLYRRMRENYVQCFNDPYYGSGFETQFRQVLAACRAPKSIKINCTGGRPDGNASAGIGNYDLNKVPELAWGGWLQGIAQCAAQNNCTWPEPFPWPYSQASDIIWHEIMHQYGYLHGEAPNDRAMVDCRISTSNTSWDYQRNTIPYIVGQCVREVIDNSHATCGDIRSCPSPNQLKLVDRVGGTTCSCVNDPGKKGLGILELKNGKLTDIAMLGDNDWIGGWRYVSSDNKIVGSGDFDGDGNKDFILSSNWGIGIVTYTKPYWRPLVVKPNGTWFGGWNFNSNQNKVVGTGDFNGDRKEDIVIQSDWGIGILTLDGRGSLTSIVTQARDTWFGSWRWDATVNSGRDKIQAITDLNRDGKADILVTSSWGIGVLTLAGNSMSAYLVQPNGTRFGGWLLNTNDNSIAGIGDFNADGKNDVVIQSPWGLGILSFDGGTSFTQMLGQPRDTWFGSWRWDATVNRGRDKIQAINDFNGDGKADILVTSSWGIGVLTLNGSSMNAYLAQSNGTRFGGWLFNSADNQIMGIGDFDDNRKKDIVIRSPWGIGVLAVTPQNNTFMVLDHQPYKSFLGSWVIENTDKTVTFGNFDKTTNSDELLFQKN